MTRTVTAWFEGEAEARRAREALAEIGIPRARIAIDRAGAGTPATRDAPGSEGWLPSLLDHLFLPDEEVATHREAVRRGLVLLTAQVPDALAGRAHALLDKAGTVDLDARETDWRAGGWSPALDDPRAPDAAPVHRRDPRRPARREPRIGRARSYVIEAPPAGQPRGANDAGGRAGGVA